VGRFIKLAEAAADSDTGVGGVKSASSGQCGFRTADSYRDLASRTLQCICLSYPAGMLEWLEQANPDLHVALTSRMPREIDESWNSSVSLHAFQNLLDQYQKSFCLARLLFQTDRACLSTQRKPGADSLNSKQAESKKEIVDATSIER
jgi:hypothetical protein